MRILSLIDLSVVGTSSNASPSSSWQNPLKFLKMTGGSWWYGKIFSGLDKITESIHNFLGSPEAGGYSSKCGSETTTGLRSFCFVAAPCPCTFLAVQKIHGLAKEKHLGNPLKWFCAFRCRQLFYEMRVTTEHLCCQPNCPQFVRNICYKSISFISRLAPPVPT